MIRIEFSFTLLDVLKFRITIKSLFFWITFTVERTHISLTQGVLFTLQYATSFGLINVMLIFIFNH